MKMPWTEKSMKKLLKEEEHDLMEVIRAHRPGEKEYEEALSKLERLYELDMDDKKLSVFNRRSFINFLEGLATIGLVLTHERWEPLPGAASKFIKNKFTSSNDSHLLM